MRMALLETTACLPVYRTYVRGTEVREEDRAIIHETIDTAKRRVGGEAGLSHAFEFLRCVLLLDPPHYAEDQKPEWARFVARYQQFTGPVMAKGLEDTASYVYNTLTSLNEVGAEAERELLPLTLEDFHEKNQERLATWPHTMNATSTHDTKRSEDVRARINVLSELPLEFAERQRRWSEWNESHRIRVSTGMAPDRNEETLIYQTLLGAWPLDEGEHADFPDRLLGYLQKANREAKLHTSWIRPDEEYESAVAQFAGAILDDSRSRRFLDDFQEFQKRIAFYGMLNGLSQTVLKTLSPGVPDFYQGTETWRLALVDPDNRRPVDFKKNAAVLEELKNAEAADLSALLDHMLTYWQDGRVKMYVTYKALEHRRTHPQVFTGGAYLPLMSTGKFQRNVVSFARRSAEHCVLAVTPRFTTELCAQDHLPVGQEVWGAEHLLLGNGFPHAWTNVFTGQQLESREAAGGHGLALAEIFSRFPVAMLAAQV
jgi:(1->4)-alpha-D-glucan 1-alpha-D-glucosylmutase